MHSYRTQSGNEGCETGMVSAFASPREREGWLPCAGQAVSRTGETAALFADIGTTYGVGDGSTTFNLPDIRGRVVAGRDNMDGNNADRLSSITGTDMGATGGIDLGEAAIEKSAASNGTGGGFAFASANPSLLQPTIVMHYFIKL